jgi:hypothetical protein
MRTPGIIFITSLMILAVSSCKKAEDISLKVYLTQTLWTYDFQESDYDDETVQLAIDIANDLLVDATLLYKLNGDFEKIIRPPGEVPYTSSGQWTLNAGAKTLTHTIGDRAVSYTHLTLPTTPYV